MSMFPNSLPGIGSTLAAVPRIVITIPTQPGMDFLPSGRIIDGFSARDPDNTTVTELRMGLLLGKISTSMNNNSNTPVVGDYGASIIGTLTNAIVGGTTTASTVSLTAAAEIVRRNGASGTLVLTAPPTTGGTVASQNLVYSAVNATTGVITHTAPAASTIAGAWLGAGDGSEVPTTILVANNYGFPMRVTDVNGANQATPLALLPITTKPYDTTMIVNYPTNAKMIAYLKAQLRIPVPGSTFSDDF